jgi:hypothetical protein
MGVHREGALATGAATGRERDGGVGGAVVGAGVERAGVCDAGRAEHVRVAGVAQHPQRRPPTAADRVAPAVGDVHHRVARGAQLPGQGGGDRAVAADHHVAAGPAGAQPLGLRREGQPERLEQRVERDSGGGEAGDLQRKRVGPAIVGHRRPEDEEL